MLSTTPFYRLQQKTRANESNLERNLDLAVAQNGMPTPALVFESDDTPLNGKRIVFDLPSKQKPSLYYKHLLWLNMTGIL